MQSTNSLSLAIVSARIGAAQFSPVSAAEIVVEKADGILVNSSGMMLYTFDKTLQTPGRACATRLAPLSGLHCVIQSTPRLAITVLTTLKTSGMF